MLKIGHRGASAYAPENTLSAFRLALEMGADGIELDVHICATGELIVIHDDTVDRTTNGQGEVAEMTLAQLKALRIESTEFISTLEEVLDSFGPDISYYIELKAPACAEPAAKLVSQKIAQGWDTQKLYVISFDHAALKTASKVTIGASFETLDMTSVSQAEAMGAAAIMPHHEYLEAAHINEAHAAGLKVIAWTVNDPEHIARLKSLGIDGIISDYPDRLADA